MPTYEYRCDNCKHEMEEFQSITAKPLRKCPKCGKNTLKRLISTGGGVIFKGSGFWQTDYARSDSYKKSAEAESKPAAESKPETKTETKPDAKPADSIVNVKPPAKSAKKPSTPKTKSK